jgi:hypothetical protein
MLLLTEIWRSVRHFNFHSAIMFPVCYVDFVEELFSSHQLVFNSQSSFPRSTLFACVLFTNDFRTALTLKSGTTETKACVSQKWKESLVATIVAKGNYCVYVVQLVSECSNILLQKKGKYSAVLASVYVLRRCKTELLC